MKPTTIISRFAVCAAIVAVATACRRDSGEVAPNNKLTVSVGEISHPALIVSKAGGKTTPADTLWLSDEIYVEAVESDMADTIATRATPIANAAGISELSIVMFNTGTGVWGAASTQESDKSPVVATKANGAFNIDKPYIWRETDTDKRTLIAISPLHTTSGLKLADNGRSLDVAVPTDIAKQADLCVSDINKNKNMVNSVGANIHNQKFEMAHMMTAIGFEATGYDLMLTAVKIKGVNSKATLTLENRTWSSLSTPTDYSAKIDADKWLTSDHIETANPWQTITPVDGYLMMLPQAHTDAMKLEFTFVGRNGQPGGVYTMNLKDIKAAGVANSDWKAGAKITYRLRLKTEPAVRATQIKLPDFKAGTTTAALNIITSKDDNLTFTWTASWLGAYVGTASSVTSPESNGNFTPFQTGVNKFSNIKFFARTENTSSIAERSATVTVTGKKSGTRTFTVIHPKALFTLSTTTVTSSWKPQTIAINYSDNSAPLQIEGMPSWCTATITNNQIQFNFQLLFDLNTRSAEITVKSGTLSKTVKLIQNSSGTGLYSMLNRNKKEVFVALTDESGTYNWNGGKSKCSSKGSGWRVPLDHELTIIYNIINPRHSEYGFKRINYWSEDYFTMAQPIYVDMNTGKNNRTSSTTKFAVRCVRGSR